MNTEMFRKFVLERIAKGHFHTLKKGVPAKKSPTGKAVKAVKEPIPSCNSKPFYGKDILRKCGATEADATDEIRRMRDEGIIHCTNKMWWLK